MSQSARLFATALLALLASRAVLFATIQVTGTASAVLTPDQVTVTVSVVGSHPASLPAAEASAAAVIASAKAALLKAGLPADAIVVGSSASVYTLTATEGPGTAALASGAWTVARPVTITLRAGGLTPGEAAAAWTAAGHRGAFTITHTVGDPTVQMDALRRAALKDARRKADLVATEAGQTIVAATAVTQSLDAVDGAGRGTVVYVVVYSHK